MKGLSVTVISLVLVILAINLVCAEKLDIEIENSYVPGDDVVFKLVLYDDDNNKIDGQISYQVLNYYTDVVKEGIVNSGEQVTYTLDTGAFQGPWKVSAEYSGIEREVLFNVMELEKIDISLEESVLVLRNVGNALISDKKILIYIGGQDQTASVSLDIGQVKKIRLTAPEGEYDVRVISGEETLEFKEVKLTGNVIGLDRVMEGNFWNKYPLISLFLVAVGLVVIIVLILKIKGKFFK